MLTSLFRTLLSCCLLLMIIQFGYAQNTLVKLPLGWVKGIQENEAVVFKGVPYAQAPVGKLRFKAPQPATPWKDTLQCTEFGPIASQYDGAQHPLKGSENCLSLNVYTPASRQRSKLPVLVWVHGGAMTGGAGKYENGHAFADRDSIVTVTINYRLGVFGFMYLGDVNSAYAASGNNGLLDCIMALKWIKENISALGGDPSKVTVIGESAGAKLVSALLTTPVARGYFKQLVLESGGVQCIRDITTAKGIRQRLLQELHVKNAADLLNLPAEQLIDAQNKVCNGVAGTNYFGPVQDGIIIHGNPYTYITQHPDHHTRYLIGTNLEESKLFMHMDKRLYHPDSGTVLKDWFGANASYVSAAYHNAASHQPADSAAARVLTQYMYQMHSYRLAQTLAQSGHQVWMYRFDYTPDGSAATHAQELSYVWYQPGQSHNDVNTELAVTMHQNWVNFIKGYAPERKNPTQWPLYKPDKHSILVFDKQPHTEVLKRVYNDPAYPTSCFLLN